MTTRSVACLIGVVLAAERNAAADGGDGFFDHIRILGSSTGQLQKDNASLTGGIGFSGENDHHFLFVLINGGVSEKQPATGAPPSAYGQFLLTPPSTDVSMTMRYRFFISDDNIALGAYAQLDIGQTDITATVAGADDKKQGFAVALDAGGAGKVVLSREKNLFLFGFLGISSRFLGGDAARDDALKMAAFGSTSSAFVGVNGSVLLQLGDVFAGIQLLGLIRSRGEFDYAAI